MAKHRSRCYARCSLFGGCNRERSVFRIWRHRIIVNHNRESDQHYMKLSKVYEPQQYEKDIYALWEKSGAFRPQGKGTPYSVVIPPPNANGNLHIGHALTLGLEDVAIRYHRLKGDRVLFVPGADHAGFETQVVYEKQLAKAGKSRFDFSRDELYRDIWQFVGQNRANFEDQIRRIGASVDWEHYTFTLDSKVVSRAYATFKKLWDDGLVYRGERLVNYCTFHGTAFADIEVEHKEEQGNLWHIRYDAVDGSGGLVIATTRPETMFGDVAVAVHPEDERYAKLVGKSVRLPLTNREIPVIADDFVEREFGTGAVKITPAHDQNDFEAGERHDLPKLTVIDNEGRMNAEVPEAYRGLEVAEARSKTVADLEAQGFLVRTEEHTHNVGHCYKCGTIIQPLLREQWFVSMAPLAKSAIEALEAGRVEFFPASKRDQLVTYLKGLRDWNISRQIAWGIPIPAFQNVDDPDDWIFDDRIDQETIAVEKHGTTHTYRRDADVFDTWFSSGSWPYATLDFPDSDDFKQFYPLSLMETGGEILYPWVSRMLMLGLYVTGEVPFKAVYIHGYVMAEDGSKMSKSIGNVINPIDVIEEYGSDALRMGILAGRTAAVNRGYDPRKVEDARNFCNKLWNMARYIEDRIGDDFEPGKPAPSSTADHWVLARLSQASHEIAEHLEAYRFAEAYETLYHFVWDDVADWYIEASKAAPEAQVMAYVLQSVLQLAHPFAPFVTETIWQTLAWQPDSPDNLVATSGWPEVPATDEAAAADFQTIQAIVSESRFLTKAFKLDKPTLYFKQGDQFFERNADMLAKLGRFDAVTGSPADVAGGVHLTQTGKLCWLDIADDALDAYATELSVRKTDQERVVKQFEGRLANTSYVENAPEAVVAETRLRLDEAQKLLENINAEIERFTR